MGYFILPLNIIIIINTSAMNILKSEDTLLLLIFIQLQFVKTANLGGITQQTAYFKGQLIGFRP